VRRDGEQLVPRERSGKESGERAETGKKDVAKEAARAMERKLEEGVRECLPVGAVFSLAGEVRD